MKSLSQFRAQEGGLCARTYATAAAGPASIPGNDLLIDEAEVEATSQSPISEIGCATVSTSERAPTLEPARKGDYEEASNADTTEQQIERADVQPDSKGTRKVDLAIPEVPGNDPVEPGAQRIVNENEPPVVAAKKQEKIKKMQKLKTSSRTSQDSMDVADQVS